MNLFRDLLPQIINARAAQLGAQNEVEERDRVRRFQDLKFGNDQEDRQIHNDYLQSQIGENNARRDALLNPKSKFRVEVDDKDGSKWLVNNDDPTDVRPLERPDTGAQMTHRLPPVRSANPPRTVGVAPSPIRTVEKQISDTRADLKDRTPKPLGPLASSADSASFRQRNAATAPLRQRLDSLNTVRDRMAAEQQGHPTGGRSVSPKDTVQTQDEYDFLRQTMTDAQIAQRYNIAKTINREN